MITDSSTPNTMLNTQPESEQPDRSTPMESASISTTFLLMDTPSIFTLRIIRVSEKIERS